MLSAEFAEACNKALNAMVAIPDGHNARLCAAWSLLITVSGASLPVGGVREEFFSLRRAVGGTNFVSTVDVMPEDEAERCYRGLLSSFERVGVLKEPYAR